MDQRRGRSWKVGELARATGLTVRTLHHYDQLGLLMPSARTDAGHRIYDEADVDRLYRVLALRELGLPLETIGAALDGQPGLATLLTEHLEHVQARLTATRALRDRLAHLVGAARRTERPDTAELLDLIEEMTHMEETIKRYFSPEQIAQLGVRREQLGEQRIREVEAEWPELIAKVQREVDAGTDPAEPRVQALATRWMRLVEAFDGGDAGLHESLHRMYQENGEQIRAQGGPSPELMDYIRRAVAATK